MSGWSIFDNFPPTDRISFEQELNNMIENKIKIGYANLSSIQEMFVQDKNSKSDFKVVDEAMEGQVAWIKYSTAYDPKPGIFKLVKEDGHWKVTHNGPRDNGPF